MIARRLSLASLCLVFITLHGTSPSVSAESFPERELSNVVVLLADDLGYRGIGCYGGPVATLPGAFVSRIVIPEPRSVRRLAVHDPASIFRNENNVGTYIPNVCGLSFESLSWRSPSTELQAVLRMEASYFYA